MMREKSLARIRLDKARNAPPYNPYDVTPPQERELTRVGGQLGSNPGGQYEDASGKKYYVKFMSEDRIQSELTANELYRTLGVNTPVTYQREVDGKQALVSEWLPGTRHFGDPLTDSMRVGAARGLPADMWLANWDVAAHGNLMVGADGKVYRMESGGALEYRAQGAKKGRDFTKTKVKELDSFFEFTDARRLMSQALETADGRKAFREGYDAIANLKSSDIRRVIKDKALADKMVSRASAMRKQKRAIFNKIDDLYASKTGAKDWPLKPGDLRELDMRVHKRLARGAGKLKKLARGSELEDVRSFTGGGFSAMNKFMLKKTEGWARSRLKAVEREVKNVTNYIRKWEFGKPPELVWRGVTDEWAQYLADKGIGDIVDIAPLTSTSLDIGVAMRFANVGADYGRLKPGIVLEIKPREGGAYVGIRGVSSYESQEKEWVMPPTHKLRKVGVQKVLGRTDTGKIVEIEVHQFEEIEDGDDV